MKIIRSKADLVEVLRGNMPTSAADRALVMGKYTLLGGFTPPSDFSSYLVDCGGSIVAIVCDDVHLSYRIRWCPPNHQGEVPWQWWVGDQPDADDMVKGDLYAKAPALKAQAIERARIREQGPRIERDPADGIQLGKDREEGY